MSHSTVTPIIAHPFRAHLSTFMGVTGWLLPDILTAFSLTSSQGIG